MRHIAPTLKSLSLHIETRRHYTAWYADETVFSFGFLSHCSQLQHLALRFSIQIPAPCDKTVMSSWSLLYYILPHLNYADSQLRVIKLILELDEVPHLLCRNMALCNHAYEIENMLLRLSRLESVVVTGHFNGRYRLQQTLDDVNKEDIMNMMLPRIHERGMLHFMDARYEDHEDIGPSLFKAPCQQARFVYCRIY
ncbi:hypothetical protein NM688_g7486 [Phlebia brevispora]|uniref:Uncharacterized protein n=1 Tax=Phlebia brevispora TaxID=194682 RepID=A0ACC1S4T5_9APHY|nr:hypothetical protein NM688_g7486 [Phlebia brevispora]